MKIFESTRIRLTLWYLLIIALISLSFSALIYRDVSGQLERGFRAAEWRLRGQLFPRPDVNPMLLVDELVAAKKLVLFRLLALNTFILVVAGIGGYFLAGKTLKPIEEMVDKQKQFIADASHELRTPLTSLRSEIEVAMRDKKLTLAQSKKLLMSNLEETNRIQKLVNYLLELGRYEGGEHQLPAEPLDVAEIATAALEKFTAQAKQKNITLVSDLRHTRVKANRQSLNQLFNILLDNAFKYTPSGGRIEVTAKHRGREVEISVADTGAGIDSSDLPYIFNRFYRADVSRSKTKVDGFGLGLAIAKSIVGQLGGEIKVKSQLGQGTTFSLLLPSA